MKGKIHYIPVIYKGLRPFVEIIICNRNYSSSHLMSLNCPGEAFPIRYSCVSHHNGVLNPSRDGSSAELLAPVVILNWSKKPALPKLWFVISET